MGEESPWEYYSLVQMSYARTHVHTHTHALTASIDLKGTSKVVVESTELLPVDGTNAVF